MVEVFPSMVELKDEDAELLENTPLLEAENGLVLADAV
jgi:hypothetical protein